MVRRVDIVTHTHWDREWYRPFPVFRMQLVELVGIVLDLLEQGALPHFQLDGQAAVLDDHLEIRPEDRPRIEALVRAGRLGVGPWYTLPDEFLVSGETLVRNLRFGLTRAEAAGGSMQIGYLPDMFGHIAQMPQILNGFGFTDAVVWRGVPAAVDRPTFTWVAPDGSSVRAIYLVGGYGNGARRRTDITDVIADLDAFVARWGEAAGDPLLWMSGTDHLLPDTGLPRMLTEPSAVAALAGRYDIRVTSLAAHLADLPPTDGLTWAGEMRSGARTQVLRGVASARLDVKAAAARAERWLERVAEPLAACWTPPEVGAEAFLDHAWLDVVRNAAHDSICGCSADEVNDAVLHRYAEATRVAEAVADRAVLRVLGRSGQGAVAVNPTSRPRAGVLTAVIPGDTPPADTQQLAVRPADEALGTVPCSAAVTLLLYAVLDDPGVEALELGPDPEQPGGVLAVVVMGPGARPDPTVTLDRLQATAAATPDAPLRAVRRRRGPSQEVLLRSHEIPGFGWRGLAPAPLGAHAVRADGSGLTNGLVTIHADAADGTFAIDGIAGFGRLIDEGDGGDTYTWSPVADDRPIDRPEHVEVRITEAGPVRGRIEIERRYRWPTHLADGRRQGHATVEVRTVVELRAGEDLVRVDVEFENPAGDHRLRMALPLPRAASESIAECAFGTVRRGLTAEGGPDEPGQASFPSRRFVSAGGLLVVHDGLPEYELVDLEPMDADGEPVAARTLAVTLLRSVGLLSRGPITARPLPAGPSHPTPAAQLHGPRRASLVLHLGGRDPYAVADEAFTPLLTARFPGRGGLGDPEVGEAALTVRGAEVTALRRLPDGRRELRLVNPTDASVVCELPGQRGELVDLAARPLGTRVDGTVALGPWQIVTVALDGA